MLRKGEKQRMDKHEFLEKLSEALRESMDDSSAYEHISYYSNYIDEEIKKGRTEQEVIDELGNPRLIAKSIIDRGGYTLSESAYATYDTMRPNASDGENNYETGGSGYHFYFNGKSINPVAGKIIGIIILIAVIALVFLVLWGISWLVLKVVLPVVLVLVLVGIIVGLINSVKRR